MQKKEITICGKPVTLAYCYATEIAYKDCSGEDIHTFLTEAIPLLQQQQMPDVKKTLFLIIASMLSYYEDEEKLPVTDKDMMREATPNEVVTALGTIIVLYSQFYHVPEDEPKDKPSEGDEKNA
jgi:hypothetical protein